MFFNACSMIDNYALKARIYPVILFLFPLILYGCFYSFEFKTITYILSSVFLVGASTYLLSQLGRDQGKVKESLLWASWGGAPSVQILRWSNSLIDIHTKQRYHQKLQSLCPVARIPDDNFERAAPQEVDEIYKAWGKYLISQTRDFKKFPLLLKDNTSYGFRRNLWGLKSYAIILNVILLLANYAFWALKLNSWNILLYPESFLQSSFISFVTLLFWIFIIRASWVKIPAFSYAQRLYEAVDQIDKAN